MTKCCVLGCKTRNNENPDYKNQKIGHHSFPKLNDSRYSAYLEATGRKMCELPQKPSICSLHFNEDDFKESDITRVLESSSSSTIKYMRLTIKECAVPSISIHHNDDTSSCGAEDSCNLSSISKLDQPPPKISKIEMCESLRSICEVSPSKLLAPRATSTPKRRGQTKKVKNVNAEFDLHTLEVSTSSMSVQCSLGLETLSNVNKNFDTSDTFNKTESNKDCTYAQESHEMNSSFDTFLSENHMWDAANCDFFLVQKNKLMTLFNFCNLCGSPANSRVNYVSGSMVEIETECLNNHSYKWQSQTMIKQKPIGNIALSSAVYLSGLQFTAFERFTETLNLKSISETTHYKNVAQYISPVLRNTWINHRKEIIIEENLAAVTDKEGTQLVIDGQYDSPGKAAYVHALNAVNVRDGKVIDFVIMKKPPIKAPKGSGDMEKQCCEVVVRRLSEELEALKVVCTDRSTSLTKLFEEIFKEIEHNYDTWHIDKGFKKIYNAVAIRKWMEKLREWKRHITNHMWYCVANCKKDPELLVKMWTSLLYHVRDIHAWEDNDTNRSTCVYGCFHTDENFTNTRHAYFDEDDDDYKALKKLVEDKKLLKDLRRAKHNIHTGPVESFHNLRIMYMPKRVSFSFGGTIDRSILAALDNNHNVGREVVGTRLIYSKKSQRWVWKTTYTEKSPKWRIDLHNSILDIEHTPQMQYYEEDFIKLFHFQPTPESSAPIPRPDVDNLPSQFSRFDYIDEDGDESGEEDVTEDEEEDDDD